MTPDQVSGFFDAGESFVEGTIAAALVVLWVLALALHLGRPYMVRNTGKFSLRLGADRLAEPDRSDSPGSLAEASPLEAPLRSTGNHRDHGQSAEAGRRIPLYQRHRRLLRMDAAASCGQPGFPLDGGKGRRLAQTAARPAIWPRIPSP